MPGESRAGNVALFWASALVLFLELTLIRYLSTEIPTVGFFKNLILIACFLGFGAGLSAAGSRRTALLAYSATAVVPVALVLVLKWLDLADAAYGGTADEAVVLRPRDFRIGAAMIAAAFVASAVPLFSLGRLVGGYLDAHRSALVAYALNIGGSVLGTVLFTAVSFLAWPPSAWLGLCSVLFWLVLGCERESLGPRHVALAAVLAVLPAAVSHVDSGPETVWTPYYKVTLSPMSRDAAGSSGYRLEVNNTWFQRSYDMDELVPGAEGARQNAGIYAARLRFQAPFAFARPERVLVLGSGLGNDTAAALRQGARTVHAVDIDPVIPKLSRSHHPNQPYSDPAVTVFVDDARHFLSASRERYDLILFGVLEARSLFSQFANLRLDNYVYTREALSSARDHLGEDGVLWLNMWVPKAWVGKKLELLMASVFEGRYAVLRGRGSKHYSFVGYAPGAGARLDAMVAQMESVEKVPPGSFAPDVEVTVPTDDWPYVFYRTRSLPLTFIALLSGLIALCVVPLRLVTKRLFQVRWGFFLMGASFLLIETSAVTRMALIAGTTWLVNGAVFFGILVFVFLANWTVLRFEITAHRTAFALLAASLALAYGFPFARLLELPNSAAIVIAAVVLTLPVFFSGIVFSVFFRRTDAPAHALASNLFGAILGGFAEYFSMLLGHSAIPLIAIALYAGAYRAFTLGR